MAMKPCKECGKQVSTSASVCPNCGKKHPIGGLTRPAKIFLGIILLMIFSSFVGRLGANKVPSDIKITQNNAVSAVEKHYKQVPIGGGWTISGTRAEGTAIKVKVLIPQASEIMADPIPKQQKTLSNACCPGDKEPLWKSIEGYRVVIEASTTAGDVFSNINCPQYAPSNVTQSEATSANVILNEIPHKKKYNHKFKITKEYSKKDKFANIGDYTSINIRYMHMANGLNLSTSFMYDGKVPEVPKTVLFHFTSKDGSAIFNSSTELILLGDGKRYTFPKPNYDYLKGEYNPYNQVFINVPIQTYLAILTSNIIEGRLGDIQFKINNSQKEALKDLASRMN